MIEEQPHEFNLAAPNGIVQCRCTHVIASIGIEAGRKNNLRGRNITGAHCLAQIRRDKQEDHDNEARRHPPL